MHRDYRSAVLCCLALSLLCGCAQPPWAKLGNPFASMALPGTTPAAPQNPLALARLSESQGRNEQAEALYLDVIKKTPNDPVPEHRLGVVYAKLGRFPAATQHFARALALAPDNCDLLNDAGYFYYLAGNRAEAERCLRRAVQLRPDDARACTNLALLLGEMKRDEECLALFRRAAPTGNQAYLNFAYVLAQRGDYQRAMDAYDRILTEDPTRRVAAEAMVELSKYAPRKTRLPPPMVPNVAPSQVAANGGVNGTTPVANAPAVSPWPPSTAVSGVTPQPLAAAVPMGPDATLPAYPPTVPNPAAAYPHTAAAYPPTAPHTAAYPTTPASTAAQPVGYWQ